MKEVTLKAKDGLMLSVAVFEVKTPKAMVQIIHGAKEHKERYYGFAEYLNKMGYAVIISDTRGHGKSVNASYPLGHIDSVDQLVEDQYLVSLYMKAHYSSLRKLVVLGHSLGSTIARAYLQKYEGEITKLVLSGTVPPNPQASMALKAYPLHRMFKGKMGKSKKLMALAGLTTDDWVCSDPAVLDAYRKDPLCNGVEYTVTGMDTIFNLALEVQKAEKYPGKNKKLAILSISGEKDPVTGGEAGLAAAIADLNKFGYSNVQNIVYPGMLHEVLNEPEKEKVYADVVKFLG